MKLVVGMFGLLAVGGLLTSVFVPLGALVDPVWLVPVGVVVGVVLVWRAGKDL